MACPRFPRLTNAERDHLRSVFARHSTPDSDGCLVWTGGRKSADELYGAIWFRGQTWRAHRLAWVLYYGRPPRLIVRHLCSNAACVNVEHLAEGTHSDNLQDAWRDGSRVASVRLNDVDKTAIREHYLRGHNAREIADILYIAESTVLDQIHRLQAEGTTHADS